MSLDAYEVEETIARTRNAMLRRAVRKSDGARVVLKSLSRAYPTAKELGQLEFEHRVLGKLDEAPTESFAPSPSKPVTMAPCWCSRMAARA
jgi:hypothetical protein